MNELFKEDDNLPPSIDPEKNYLEELVGENKKFKSPEELARGKAEADAWISHLQSQMDRLREDYLKERETNNSRARLEEILAEMKQLKSASNVRDDESTVNETNNKSAIDPDTLEPLISKKIAEIEQKRTKEANLEVVKNKLRERFGNNYQNSLREQTTRLGLNEDVLMNLAETSPTAFFKVLGLEDKQDVDTSSAPPRNEQNTSLSQQAAHRIKQGTWAWYEELRKANPAEYWTPKTQSQLHKDRQRLGDAFYN